MASPSDPPTAVIDVNADVGESLGHWSMGDDAPVLDVVTSASVACGFHAGDPSTMRRACELAVSRGVTIGAHVAYDDLRGFGRRFMEVDPTELADQVSYQVAALTGIAAAAGGAVSYVKPHGALYNAVVRHEGQAYAVAEAVARLGTQLSVVTSAGSALHHAAEVRGLQVITEGLLDRAYQNDGTLVPRSQPGAVLSDLDEIVARAVTLGRDGFVISAAGTVLALRPETLCLHGDTVDAAQTLRAVRTALAGAGVAVTSFA